jgi:hypothetical protein
MIQNQHTFTRNLLSESDSRKMARKYSDNRFQSTNLSILCEAYNELPLDSSLISEYGLTKHDKMALLIISEASGEHPEDVLLEFFGAIKKLGKKIGAAIAEPFKKFGKARKEKATVWQSVKHGMTALPQLFKHGTHFGQGEASEKANAAYQKILSDFENQSNKRLKELTAAAKELSQSDFPNNARPEDFRMMLMGKENFSDIESEGLGGLLGAMLDVRQSQQQFVDQGGDIKIANQIISRMKKMLQFHMGELHDTYQSLENRDRYGKPLIRDALSVSLMDLYYDNDYWYRQVCEGIITEAGTSFDEILDSQALDKEEEEAVKQATQDKSPEEIGKMFSDEGLEGLSDEHLNSMKAASSAMRPLLVACLGAAMTALGVSQGGSMVGDFESSEAFTKMLKSLEGTKIIELPAKVSEQITTALTDVSVNPGEGLTQFVGRIGGASANQIQGMSGSEFVTFAKENGITAESMKGLLGNSGQAFESLGSMEGTIGELGSQIGNGKIPSDPFNMSLGSTSIKKKIAQSVFKAAKNYTVKSFAAGAVGKASIGAALPTVLATAGVGIATSGIAIAALRKFAKNRKKTLMAAIELLKPIEGPTVGAPATDPNNVGPESPIPEPEEELETQGIADELPLDLFKRSLKDKGYEKEDELTDAMFQDPNMIKSLVQDTPPKPQSLTAGYRRELRTMSETVQRWGHLAGMNEDVAFDDFAGMTKAIAKNADLPEPTGDQLGFGAQALNVTRGLGDVNDLPGEFAKEEFENKISELEKLIESMKLENNEAVRGMLDTLATKVGLDPSNYKDLENDEYMAKLGETWENDQAAWEDAMEEVEGLKMQLAAANQGLDEAEAKIVEQSAQLDKYIEENSHLIANNKRAKKTLARALDLAKKQHVEIGDLKTGLSQAEDLNKLKDKEIDELTGELGNALSEIRALKEREEKLNSRLIDLRKLYLALSKASGSSKTTYDRKHDQKKRNKVFTSLADSFEELGDEFPALRDTGKIIKKSMEAGVNSSVKGSGQLKTGGGRNEPGARSKKEESSWRRGDLIMEKLKNL